MDQPMGSPQDGFSCEPPRSETGREVGNHRPRSGLRILVVDDEVGIRRALRRMLGRDHEVATAQDGWEARVRLASGERFDVILCDLMMPRMSGTQLHEALAKEAPEDAARIVFMTGGVVSESTGQLLRGSKNPLLQKPLSRETLEAAFRAVLEAASARGSRGPESGATD